MKPDYTVSTPIESKKDGKDSTFWLRIGVGFKKEKGISIVLNALPINGKMFIAKYEEKKDKETPSETLICD